MRLVVGSVEHDLTTRALVMGIVNVSPESAVSSPTVTEALARARRLVADGADIIDIGAVSGGAPTISVDEEVSRLLPALEVIRANVRVPISVDTARADVLAVALAAGALIANDVSGFVDEGYLDVAATVDATVIATDAFGVEPGDDPAGVVAGRLAELVRRAEHAGVRHDRIVVDAGLGVNKDDAASRALLRGTGRLAEVGRPVLLAASRKVFLGDASAPDDALMGAACGATALALWQGARLVRTHDARAARRVADVVAAILEAA